VRLRVSVRKLGSSPGSRTWRERFLVLTGEKILSYHTEQEHYLELNQGDSGKVLALLDQIQSCDTVNSEDRERTSMSQQYRASSRGRPHEIYLVMEGGVSSRKSSLSRLFKDSSSSRSSKSSSHGSDRKNSSTFGNGPVCNVIKLRMRSEADAQQWTEVISVLVRARRHANQDKKNADIANSGSHPARVQQHEYEYAGKADRPANNQGNRHATIKPSLQKLATQRAVHTSPTPETISIRCGASGDNHNHENLYSSPTTRPRACSAHERAKSSQRKMEEEAAGKAAERGKSKAGTYEIGWASTTGTLHRARRYVLVFPSGCSASTSTSTWLGVYVYLQFARCLVLYCNTEQEQ
jgi:hypothetical protein